MTGLTERMLDHYHLREQIGRGGMATVYRAIDTRQLQEVAMKVLSPTIGGERRFVKRFRREAELVKQKLTHPNIVPVIDYGEVRGFVYLVMPFISGDTLLDRMSKGSIPRSDLSKWIGQVTDALAFAHEQGIIHRDIKPSNVLINESNDAMLADFGLAREIEGSNTLTGSMLMGTPAYISPEQGRGEKLDPRSDQYSLGVVLYQLASGRLPFETASPMGTVMAHLQEPVPRPGRFNPNLQPDVEKVVLKSLAKNKEDRFASVTALNEAYQAALAGRSLPWFKLPSEQKATGRDATAQISEDVLVTQPVARRFNQRILPIALISILVISGVGLFGPSILRSIGISPPSGQPSLVPTSTTISGSELPTNTPIKVVPSPTNIATFTSEACPGFSLSRLSVSGNSVTFLVDNGSLSEVQIQDFGLREWPASNGALERFRVGDEILWEGEHNPGDTFEVPVDAAMRLAPESVTMLEFGFHWGAGDRPYTLEIVLDAGCTLRGEW